ncbi:hypothetical protein [Methylobacillus sp. Pita1]|uniref:hypothetical protein n=1 Tax=Methylobacillus sp. Pita1 TaxID=3382642 RepID=UPI0038B68573
MDSYHLKENLIQINIDKGMSLKDATHQAFGALAALAFAAVVDDNDHAKERIRKLSQEVKHG